MLNQYTRTNDMNNSNIRFEQSKKINGRHFTEHIFLASKINHLRCYKCNTTTKF